MKALQQPLAQIGVQAIIQFHEMTIGIVDHSSLNIRHGVLLTHGGSITAAILAVWRIINDADAAVQCPGAWSRGT
jgi:hypothetical protein